MDVRAVLLSVQERDKWRHRLGVLERSLNEIRERRHRVARRLRRLKRELARLTDYSDALLDSARRPPGGGPIHVAGDRRIPAR